MKFLMGRRSCFHYATMLRWLLAGVFVILFCLWNGTWSRMDGSGRHTLVARQLMAQSPAESMDGWSVAQMLDYLESNQAVNRTACRLFYEFGGSINPSNKLAYKDGQKSVCVDAGLAPKVNNCLVYSFGIDNEWSFDDEMARLGCHVYSFDPSMETLDYNRSDRIHFYQMGLWDKDGLIVLDKIHRPGVYWKVMTLLTIYTNFRPAGHGDSPIDYVKIDVEGDEWTILPQIMRSGVLENVKQLGLEVHFTGGDRPEVIRNNIQLLRSLEWNHGFIPFDYKVNLASKGLLVEARDSFSCAEIAFYNSKFRE